MRCLSYAVGSTPSSMLPSSQHHEFLLPSSGFPPSTSSLFRCSLPSEALGQCTAHSKGPTNQPPVAASQPLQFSRNQTGNTKVPSPLDGGCQKGPSQLVSESTPLPVPPASGLLPHPLRFLFFRDDAGRSKEEESPRASGPHLLDDAEAGQPATEPSASACAEVVESTRLDGEATSETARAGEDESKLRTQPSATADTPVGPGPLGTMLFKAHDHLNPGSQGLTQLPNFAGPSPPATDEAGQQSGSLSGPPASPEEGAKKDSGSGRGWIGIPGMDGLQGLWGGKRGLQTAVKQHQRREPGGGGAAAAAQVEGLAADLVTATTQKPAKASAWALGALLDWRKQQQEEGKEPADGAATSGAAAGGACRECGDCCSATAVKGVTSGGAALSEAPRLTLAHTAESLQPFLRPVALPDLQQVSLMSILCHTAYMLSTINESPVFRKNRLRLVTTSLERRAAIAAKAEREKARRELEEEQQKLLAAEAGGPGGGGDSAAAAIGDGCAPGGGDSARAGGVASSLSPYTLAASAASYLHSQSRALPFFRKGSAEKGGAAAPRSVRVAALPESASELLPDGASLENLLTGGKDGGKEGAAQQQPPSPPVVSSAAGSPQRGGVSQNDTDHNGTSLMCAPSSSEGETSGPELEKGQPGTESQCPCEWFVADEPGTRTRHFVIQGSSSLASWQANVAFDPVPFEDPDLGVLVHRGIYEAAKGLYVQVAPLVRRHLAAHGAGACFSFTGHSLGGSLAMLLRLMLQMRGDAPPAALGRVYTFGSPAIMCGGDHLLGRLGVKEGDIQQVMMHRDLVPRVFACDYPDHIAEVLRRIHGSFREHPCLRHQKLMYAPMGQTLVLQPDMKQSPYHPLLPPGSGLYTMRHPKVEAAPGAAAHGEPAARHAELRAAQRALMNSPHPLEILADRGSYGHEGSISRDHDPKMYMNAVTSLLRQQLRRSRRVQRESRRQHEWLPLVALEEGSRECNDRDELLGVDSPLEGPAMATSWQRLSPPCTQRLRGGRKRLEKMGAVVDVTSMHLAPVGDALSMGKQRVGGIWGRAGSLIGFQSMKFGILALAAAPLLEQVSMDVPQYL